MSIVGHVREIWRYAVKSMGGERLPGCELDGLGIPGDRGWALRDEEAGEIRGAKKIPLLMQCAARYLEEPSGDAIPPVAITLADGSTVRSDDPEASARLSAALGRRVTLCPRRPAADTDHYRRAAPDNPDFEAEMRSIFGRLPDEPLPDLSNIPPEIFEFTSPLGTYFDVFPLHVLTDTGLDNLRRREPAATFDTRRFRPNFLVEMIDRSAQSVETAWTNRVLRIGSATIKVEIPTVRCVMTTLAQPNLAKEPKVLRTIVREADQCLGVYATVLEAGSTAVGDRVELVES